jgi:hypothetical protein
MVRRAPEMSRAQPDAWMPGDDAVGIAGDDLGRRADCPIARRQSRDRGHGVNDILAVRAKLERPRHKRDTRRFNEFRRRRVRRENPGHARAHASQAERQSEQAAKRRPKQGMRAERVIPRDAAQPGVTDWRDQHERARNAALRAPSQVR